jgi:hypothetical protein
MMMQRSEQRKERKGEEGEKKGEERKGINADWLK